jgi:hypothetical protein
MRFFMPVAGRTSAGILKRVRTPAWIVWFVAGSGIAIPSIDGSDIAAGGARILDADAITGREYFL